MFTWRWIASASYQNEDIALETHDIGFGISKQLQNEPCPTEHHKSTTCQQVDYILAQSKKFQTSSGRVQAFATRFRAPRAVIYASMT
jgi:hypothetical protein